MTDWDDMRRLLGFQYSAGSWFFVDDANVRRRDGKPFSSKAVKRPVVLATDLGPKAVLFPRTTQDYGAGVRHAAHDHTPEPSCRINKPGRVLLRDRDRVRVEQALLDQSSYSCEEPHKTGLLGLLHKALEP